jgi:hypothetical protein
MTDAPAPSIRSLADFRAAVGWGFAAAFDEGARRIICCDLDFALWPLDDEALLQGLTLWLRQPQRRLDFLARDFDEIPRRFARFMRWRRDWAHAISYWQAPAELAGDLPCVLVTEGQVSVQLLDAEHWRGRAQRDARAAHLHRQKIDVVLQRSELSFAVNILGL